MSALPSKADKIAHVSLCPLCAKSDRMHRNQSARWVRAIAFLACYHDQDLPKDGWNAYSIIGSRRRFTCAARCRFGRAGLAFVLFGSTCGCNTEISSACAGGSTGGSIDAVMISGRGAGGARPTRLIIVPGGGL